MTPFGLIGDWSPGIGDPTLMGWLTVAGYFFASWLCWRALKELTGERGVAVLVAPFMGLRSMRRWRGAPRSREESAQRLAALWLCLAALMLLLGMNKQLDLQTALTEVGRILSHSQGWYEQRHVVQIAFIGVVGIVGIAGLTTVALLARGHARRLRLALLGAAFVVTFVMLRASSFHHMDRLIGAEVGGLRMNWILELGGITCVALSAWKNSGLSLPSWVGAGRFRRGGKN